MQRASILLITWLFLSPLSYAEQVLTFSSANQQLTGYYLQPSSEQPAKAVLVFVQGDGALDYQANGYYPIIWQKLLDQGYAIFSWDKPGVGKSTGNWLQQTMADRQQEVSAAVTAIQQQFGFTKQQTGLIGFSQAGWVVPALAATDSNIGFIVGIGFATNWIQQGQYLSRIRIEQQGGDEQQRRQVLAEYAKSIKQLDKSLSYKMYQAQTGDTELTQHRYQFILNNYRADASEQYLKITVPSLLLWGAQDLNVDAQHEFNQQQQLNNPWITAKLINNASHAMLNSSQFDSQNISFTQWLKLIWLQQDALATDFLPTMLNWLNQHQQNLLKHSKH